MIIDMEWWQLVVILLLGLATYQIYYISSMHIDVPAVGVPPGVFGPWKAALSWASNSEALLRDGLRRFGKDGTPFKVSTPARWLVFITSPEALKEIKDSEYFSFTAAMDERISLEYTMSKDLTSHPYHIEIITKNFTHSVLPETVDEFATAFEEHTTIGPEWTGVDNSKLMLNCISRATNRLLIGPPLCRKQDYLDRVVEFTTRMSRAGQIIDMYPWFLKSIVSKFVINRDEALHKVVTDIGPIFEARREKLREFGNQWTDRPNDAIQWITEAAPPNASIEDLCLRILFLNLASIHTTSKTMAHVLFDLAAFPEYQDPLREEIETVLRKFGGWKKQAFTHMRKLDSVLRESQRMNGVVIASVTRKARVPYTMCDSTYLPKGTWIFSPASAIHHSEMNYENPMEFNGFRFSRMREQPGFETKYQAASTANDYLPFGHGSHACPGRFFAVDLLKVILAYIICNYELKTVHGMRPDNGYYGVICMPSTTKLLFRERPDRECSPVNLYK